MQSVQLSNMDLVIFTSIPERIFSFLELYSSLSYLVARSGHSPRERLDELSGLKTEGLSSKLTAVCTVL